MPNEIHEGVCLRLHHLDNVATALAAFPGGSSCLVTAGGESLPVTLGQDIPFGHKVALESIPEGARVVKYGQPIGIATVDIATGDHVHRHNVKSVRGTGKTEGEKA